MTLRQTFSSAAATSAAGDIGHLPEWDLTDLYPGTQSPEIQGDLEKAARDSEAFEARWKGTLEVLAREGGLVEPIRQYEALDELLGRLAPLPKSQNLGMLIVDHDMHLIMRLCHRLHVLNYGRTIAQGTPQEVRHIPEVIEAYLGREAAQEAAHG